MSPCMLWRQTGVVSPPTVAGAEQLSSGARSIGQTTRMPRLPRSGRQETNVERMRGSLVLRKRTNHILLVLPATGFQLIAPLETQVGPEVQTSHGIGGRMRSARSLELAGRE